LICNNSSLSIIPAADHLPNPQLQNMESNSSWIMY
jgi:hypothetical protein